MLVKDLQQFLGTFTDKLKGNAISTAKIYVERDGFLEEIKLMEVYENNQTIFGATKNHHSHRLVMKTKKEQKIIIPDKLRSPLL